MSSRVTPFVWVMLIGTALAGLAGLSPGEAHGEDTADLILRHGVFYPVQPSGRIEGSLAVRGGRIVYLGPDAGADRLRGPKTRVIDLAGRAVTPGLIDAHSHLVGLGQALQEVDLTGTATYEEIVRKVREAASRVPAGTWVRGRGWDQNDWPEKQFPTHEALSAAVPDHPVWLTRVDGHAALVNARAMQVLGIDAALKDPSGGRFLRGPDGRPTGVLIDNAMGVVEGRLPDASVEDRQRALRLAARHCVELGLTTVTDMGIGDADYRAYSALRKAGELPLRAALFLTDDDRLLTHWFERGPEIDPDARLLVRGVKMYIDGALGSRGAALLEPYSDDPGNLGLLVSTGDHLEDVSRKALAAGFQVGIHAIGDRGGLVALDAMERAFGVVHRRDGPRPASGWSTPRCCASKTSSAWPAGDHRLHAAHPCHVRHAVGGRPGGRAAPRRGLRLAQGAERGRPAGPGERLPRGIGGPAAGPLRRRDPPGPPGQAVRRLAPGRAADPRGGPARLHAGRGLVALPGEGGRLARDRQAGGPGGLRPRSHDGSRGGDPQGGDRLHPGRRPGDPREGAHPVTGRRSRIFLALVLILALAVPARAGDGYEALRQTMVEQQVRKRGITQPEVLAAMEQVPRHLFVPESLRDKAYSDEVLVVGPGRTVYTPYVVALMTSLLDLKKGDKVLEVGTGSGYHAAVLSRIAREVYSVEIDEPVANQASKRLTVLGYHNVEVLVGDGYQGWPGKKPFDAILFSVAPKEVPKALLQQLRVGGKMVVPVGGFFQDLLVITKTADGLEKRTIIPVRLQPMVQNGGK